MEKITKKLDNKERNEGYCIQITLNRYEKEEGGNFLKQQKLENFYLSLD